MRSRGWHYLELLLAVGLACTYIGLISSIVLEGLEAGGLTSAAKGGGFRIYALYPHIRGVVM
jgi:hypothetical protein